MKKETQKNGNKTYLIFEIKKGDGGGAQLESYQLKSKQD